MQFQNNRTPVNMRSIEEIALTVFAGLFSISFMGVYKNSYLPLKDYQYAIIIVLIFAIASYLWYNLKHSYIEFNSDSNFIVIKYFVVRIKILGYKPKMIKIPKKDYVKYEIVTDYFGKRKALYLYQKTTKGIVKYPPVYITSLNDTELYKLKQALSF